MAGGDFSYLDAGEVQRHAARCVGFADCFAVNLDAAYADATVLGLQMNGVSHMQAAGLERAGDDCAKAAHGEGTIQGKAEDGVRTASRHARRELREGPLESRDSRAGAGGDSDDGSIFEEGVLGEAPDLLTRGFKSLS